MSKYNIHIHYGANVTAIDGEKKAVEFETKVIGKNLNPKLSSKNDGCFGIIENSADKELKK